MSSESVEVLFSKHNVGEIRDVEKKTRHEIETKKEDLRQMVGERYRDLIEAADTIAEMKNCAATLSSSVHSLQKYAQLRFDRVDYLKKESHQAFSLAKYLEISAQVKLIMEVSETIWLQIESGNMTEATHLYLQSRQVLKNLSLDGSTTYCPILNWFPVLGQQAQALDNLRTTILNECRKLMSDDSLDYSRLAEAICSTIFLENKTIEDTFNEFMQIRLAAVASKFESNQEMGATKLSKAVVMMTSTLKQVNALFVSHFPCNEQDLATETTNQADEIDIGLVQHILKKSFKIYHENAETVLNFSFSEDNLWARHLPDTVSRLVLVSDTNSGTSIETSKIQARCNQWVKDCENIVRDGTSDILLYVATFKALNALRETLRENLQEDTSGIGEPVGNRTSSKEDKNNINHWQEACLTTLGHEFSIWKNIMKDLFLSKVKVLCERMFCDLLVAARENIKETLVTVKSGKEIKSTSEFIWSESPGDILPDTAWRQISIKKSHEIKGGLGLKALTVTPIIHGVCQCLNGAMKQAISEVSIYVPDIMKASKNRSKYGDFEIDETPAIREYFKESCTKCLRDLLNILDEHRQSYRFDKLGENDFQDEILFLSNLCRNFCHLCNEFRVGCTLSNHVEDISFKRQMSTSLTSNVSTESSQSTSKTWDDITKQFLEKSNTFLKTWSSAIVKSEIENFRSWLLDMESALLFFDTIANWDSIKIEEESESGSKVESEIKIPSCCSWPVQELLFSISNGLSRVGGHSFTQSALRNMTQMMLDGVLFSYSDLKDILSEDSKEKESLPDKGVLNFQPTQSWALQKLFDLRVFYGILHSGHSNKRLDVDHLFPVKEEAFSELVDWLEGFIDPFDLDVFTPYLTKNVQRAVSSTRSLFGFISSDKADFHQQSSQTSKSGSYAHNIVPIIPDCPRFSYLPISTKASSRDKMALPASVKNNLPLSSAFQQLTEVDKKMAGGRKQSLYSKLGALSSSWLSSVTSEN